MKKSYILIIIFIFFVIGISVLGSIMVTGNESVKVKRDILEIQKNKEVYFNGYGYRIDNPNIIINPYGNSPLTALVMFETSDYSEVEVSILSKDGNSDINYTFGKNKHHIIPIYGLYADYDNKVIIRSEGKENTLSIKTDPLPEDFNNTQGEADNFKFYNGNYPYAVDINNEVRWYLNSNYYGNITVLDNANIIIGSDKYTEDGNTISLYQMNLLGKVYNEYIMEEGYMGYNTIYDDSLLVLSDKVKKIDMQTGKLISNVIDNDDYDYLGSNDEDIILGKENTYYKVDEGNTEEVEYSPSNDNYSFYDEVTNYNIVGSNRFGKLKETEKSSKKISLFKYDKVDEEDTAIDIYLDNNRIVCSYDGDEDVYLILDKFLDKRIYEVNDTVYINNTKLHGKYTVYYKLGDKVYKTNYYVEV